MGRTINGWVGLGIAIAALAAPAWGQQYPVKPLKMILPFPAGGPTDIVARAMGQGLAEALGYNVVIDNRPGGGGMIGATLAARAPADGYTLLLGGITTFGVAPSVHKNPPYDSVKDFQPVTLATRQPIMLMTHPSLPAKSLKEFIALAKARPGDINYASSGPGGSGHMAGELFKLTTGVNLGPHSVQGRAAGFKRADRGTGAGVGWHDTYYRSARQIRAGCARWRSLAAAAFGGRYRRY